MNVQRGARNSAIALAAALLIGAGASSPVVAAQVPYTCQIVISMEFGQGARKISVMVNCADPGELVRIDIIANVPSAAGAAPSMQTRQLAMLRADAEGVARGSITLPKDMACDATIKATGMQSKRTAYSDIHIEPCDESELPTAQAESAGPGSDSTGGTTEQISLASSGDSLENTRATDPELMAANSAAAAGGMNSGVAAAGLGLILAAGAAGAIALRRREGRNIY
jgi:hypothetical protein